jgi:hypothetical protein
MRERISSRLKIGCSDTLVSGIAFPQCKPLVRHSEHFAFSLPINPTEPVPLISARHLRAKLDEQAMAKEPKISTVTNPDVGREGSARRRLVA